MTTYIELGDGQSLFWHDAVADVASLPTSDVTGAVRLTLDTGALYWWDGNSWEAITGGGSSYTFNDTDSIDLTDSSGTVTGVVRISGDAASAGFFKATTTVKSGGSPGLHVEAPVATSSLTGFISSADWSTFNAKEPAISSGTTSQYWRGDKSFQTLNTAAIVAETGGSAAATGKIGEVLSADQSTATSTGVGATGDFGSAVSVSLTAGVWMLTGVAGFKENGATLTTSLSCAFSASATGAGLGALDVGVYNHLVSSTSDLVAPAPSLLVNISSTTTYHLNTRFYYTAGSPQHYGRIHAVRMR